MVTRAIRGDYRQFDSIESSKTEFVRVPELPTNIDTQGEVS